LVSYIQKGSKPSQFIISDNHLQNVPESFMQLPFTRYSINKTIASVYQLMKGSGSCKHCKKLLKENNFRSMGGPYRLPGNELVMLFYVYCNVCSSRLFFKKSDTQEETLAHIIREEEGEITLSVEQLKEIIYDARSNHYIPIKDIITNIMSINTDTSIFIIVKSIFRSIRNVRCNRVFHFLT